MKIFAAHINKSTFCIALVLFFSVSVYAQNQSRPNQYGQWLVYTGDNKISKRIGIHSEIQLRNYLVENTVAQSLVRTGINWYIDPLVMITAGYGFFYTSPTRNYVNGSNVREHRIWQQVITRHKTRAIFMEHRYRLEQRFIHNITKNTDTYDTRIRYRFQAIVPLYLLTPHLRHFFASANNEVFINLGRKVSGQIFDRNRLYAGFGYQVSPKMNFQLGYMNHLISIPGVDKADIGHHLQFSISYNMDDLMKTIFSRKADKQHEQQQ